MLHQKDKFQLEEGIRYINCAYMAPLMKSVEERGIEGLIRKRQPHLIKPSDFFNEVEGVKQKFAQLLNGNASQVAIIPSVSYGFASALKNIKYRQGQKAILIEGEFPSGYLSAEKWCNDHQAELQIIKPTVEIKDRAKNWNEKLIDAIDDRTAFVLISLVHWMDGTLFDLKQIGEKCKLFGAKLLVDGTQGIGAMPIDIQDHHIDFLCCAGYKWLMGPYSQGLAYVGQSFLDGNPIEESWMNRSNAHDFAQLANYGKNYFPDANRFNVGETSDFIKMPMVDEALNQLLNWGLQNIQDYCSALLDPVIHFLKEHDFFFEDEQWRAAHLLGFYLPKSYNTNKLLMDLQKEKIFLSMRGESIRISPNVYNTQEDMEMLIQTLRQNL